MVLLTRHILHERSDASSIDSTHGEETTNEFSFLFIGLSETEMGSMCAYMCVFVWEGGRVGPRAERRERHCVKPYTPADNFVLLFSIVYCASGS